MYIAIFWQAFLAVILFNVYFTGKD